MNFSLLSHQTNSSLPCTAFRLFIIRLWASQVVLVVKNLPANSGDIREVDWLP